MSKVMSALILIGLLLYAIFMPLPCYDIYQFIGRIIGAVMLWGVIMLLSKRRNQKLEVGLDANNKN